MIREDAENLGYTHFASHDLKALENWDDAYTLIDPRIMKDRRDGDEFLSGFGKWYNCKCGNGEIKRMNLHRRLKPGLEKVKIKEGT